MNPKFALSLGLSACLLFLSGAAAAEESWAVQLRIYQVPGAPDKARPPVTPKEGEVLRLGEKAFEYRDGRLLPVSGPEAAVPKLLAEPRLVMQRGIATISSGDPTDLQFFEPVEEDLYRLKAIQDALGIICTINFKEIRGDSAVFDIVIDASLVASRQALPGISLPVGAPTISKTTCNTTLLMEPKLWYLVTGAISEDALVILVQAEPAEQVKGSNAQPGATPTKYVLDAQYFQGGKALDAAVRKVLGDSVNRENLKTLMLTNDQTEAMLSEAPKSSKSKELIFGPRGSGTYSKDLPNLQDVFRRGWADDSDRADALVKSLKAAPDGGAMLTLSTQSVFTETSPAPHPLAKNAFRGSGNLVDDLEDFDSYFLSRLVKAWQELQTQPLVIADFITEFFNTPVEENFRLYTGSAFAVTARWNAETQRARVQIYANHTYQELERISSTQRSRKKVHFTTHQVIGNPLIAEIEMRDGECRGFYLDDTNNRESGNILVVVRLSNVAPEEVVEATQNP